MAKKKKQQVTAQNIPVPDPKFPIPGETADPNKPDLREYYTFGMTDILFLQEFAKDLDLDRARKQVGWAPKTLRNKLLNQHIKDEMQAIFDSWKHTIHMTADVAAGRFVKNLTKLEKAFDGGEMSVASALAKMSGDFLKATGHFDSAQHTTAPQVSINIDLGGQNDSQTDTKDITIEVNENDK